MCNFIKARSHLAGVLFPIQNDLAKTGELIYYYFQLKSLHVITFSYHEPHVLHCSEIVWGKRKDCCWWPGVVVEVGGAEPGVLRVRYCGVQGVSQVSGFRRYGDLPTNRKILILF